MAGSPPKRSHSAQRDDERAEPRAPARRVERLVFTVEEVEPRRDRIAYLLAVGAARAAKRTQESQNDDDHNDG